MSNCDKCKKSKCCCPKVISKLGYRGKGGSNGRNGSNGAPGPQGPIGPAGPAGAGATWNNIFIPDPGIGNGTDIYNGGSGVQVSVDPALPAGTNIFWFGSFLIEAIDPAKVSVSQVINNVVDTAELFEDTMPPAIGGKTTRIITVCGWGGYTAGQSFKVELKASANGGGSIKVRTIQVSYFTL